MILAAFSVDVAAAGPRARWLDMSQTYYSDEIVVAEVAANLFRERNIGNADALDVIIEPLVRFDCLNRKKPWPAWADYVQIPSPATVIRLHCYIVVQPGKTAISGLSYMQFRDRRWINAR